MLLRQLVPSVGLNETLKRVNGRWALVSKSDPRKVLQYYHGGDQKPSEEWVKKVERRVHSFESVIMEGGNAFKDDKGQPLTGRIQRADVEPTVRWLENITGYSLFDHLLGTTGKKESSGDIDIGMEPTANKDELIVRLGTWCAEHDLDPKQYIKKSGVNVHFRTPIGGATDRGYVQTDFMFVPNLDFAKFAMAADPHSKFKDAYKQITLSSLAKPLNLLYNPTTGLTDRASKKLVTADPDKIAQILIGPGASRTDISSLEAILKALENDPQRDAKLADARETLAKDGIEI